MIPTESPWLAIHYGNWEPLIEDRRQIPGQDVCLLKINGCNYPFQSYNVPDETDMFGRPTSWKSKMGHRPNYCITSGSFVWYHRAYPDLPPPYIYIYMRSGQNTLLGPSTLLNVIVFGGDLIVLQCFRTLADPARKSQLCSTSLVREVHFRISSSKIATL